jgi:hypothetical protein
MGLSFPATIKTPRRTFGGAFDIRKSPCWRADNEGPLFFGKQVRQPR